MLKFKKNIIIFYKQIKKLIQKESITKLNSYKLQTIFMNDLKTQFRKMIIKDGKYKSNFCAKFREIELLETGQFILEEYFFKIKKIFRPKKHFFRLTKLFRPKKMLDL